MGCEAGRVAFCVLVHAEVGELICVVVEKTAGRHNVL